MLAIFSSRIIDRYIKTTLYVIHNAIQIRFIINVNEQICVIRVRIRCLSFVPSQWNNLFVKSHEGKLS